MKYKTFIYSIIFLTILQLFSPLMVNFSESGISIKKNIVQAANTRSEIKKENKDAFLVVTDFTNGPDNKRDGSIEITSYTSPSFKINNLKLDFIRDEFSDIETGCPAGNLELFSNKNLSSLTATGRELVGFNSSTTSSQIYLKSKYKINVSAPFKTECVDDNVGIDAWGHYKFTYEVEDTSTKKFTKTEETTTGKAIEENKEYSLKTVGLPFVSAQGQSGENFDISWGVLSLNDSIETQTSSRTGVTGVVCNADINLIGDKSYSPKSTEAGSGKYNETKKIKYFQADNQEYRLYQYMCSTSVSESIMKPKISGTQKSYILNFKNSGRTASLDFNLPIIGKSHSFKELSDASDTSKIIQKSCVADWCLKDFSLELQDFSKQDDGIYLQTKINIFLSDGNVDKFKPFVDRDKNGVANDGDTPGNWVSFLGDKTNDKIINIEDRPAKDGNGFYLVWGTENNHTVKDSTHNEINLSPYLFGDKFKPSSIVEGESGMSFEIPVGPLNYGETYYFKLYGSDAGEGYFDLINDGYSATYSKPANQKLEDITQQAREELIAGGEVLTNVEWMPKCDILDGYITGCFIQVFYYLVFVPTAYLLTVAGSIMDWVLLYSIKPDAYTVGYIKDSWRFVRDVMNLGFIFMLIYLAFKVMLGVGKGTKQLIVNTVIIATIINFSYPLATVVIDVSNITARQLYYNAFNKKDGDGKPVGLSTMVAAGFNPQRLISGAGEQGKTAEERDNNKGTIFMIILMGVAFNIIAMIIFLKVALQFIYRILGLVFAIILSPVAIFSYSLAPETRSKLKMVGFEEWMSGLIKDSFKAPIFLFLILILALFVNNTPFANMFKDGVDGIDWWMSMLIPFMMIVGFLGLISKITKETSSSLADLAGSMVMKGIGAVAGVAMGGAALAGSSFIGKAATRFVGSSMGQKIMDKASNGSFIAKAQTKILRKAQTGSFDLRQTGIGNAVSKETGANFNALTSKIDSVAGALGSTRGLSTGILAGGYLAGVDRKNKKNDDFVKMLEYNKNLASRDEDRKDEKDKEKSKLEDDLKDEKYNLKDKEKKLQESQKVKLDADELIKEIESLKDLMAKKDDLITRGAASTTEVDEKIKRLQDKVASKSTQSIQNGISTAGGWNNTLLNQAELEAKNKKDRAKTLVDGRKRQTEESKNKITSTEKSIDTLNKEINALTKSIENIKNNRKNAFTQNVRNKSGHIYGRETYQSKMDAKVEAITDTNLVEQERKRAAKRAELEAEFVSTFGNMADEMRNVITSIDSRSNTVNTKYIRNQTIATAALGSAIGLFTGGLAGLAAGAGVGGVVGAARSYQPGNESYGTSHTEWRPEVRDTYTPPTNS